MLKLKTELKFISVVELKKGERKCYRKIRQLPSGWAFFKIYIKLNFPKLIDNEKMLEVRSEKSRKGKFNKILF